MDMNVDIWIDLANRLFGRVQVELSPIGSYFGSKNILGQFNLSQIKFGFN